MNVYSLILFSGPCFVNSLCISVNLVGCICYTDLRPQEAMRGGGGGGGGRSFSLGPFLLCMGDHTPANHINRPAGLTNDIHMPVDLFHFLYMHDHPYAMLVHSFHVISYT